MFEKILRYLRAIPKRKHYLEFITATLSVPVLATAIFINIANLNKDEEAKSPEPERIIISYSPQENNTSEKKEEPANEKTEVCIKEVGPVEISYPNENDIVTDNPLNVRINYDSGEYCEVVWSYRINNGKWSEYDDSSFSLYNLPNGSKTLEVRVKSIASSDEKTLKRTFDYQGTEAMSTPTGSAPVTVAPTGQ